MHQGNRSLLNETVFSPLTLTQMSTIGSGKTTTHGMDVLGLNNIQQGRD
jgi:hypothetical protein